MKMRVRIFFREMTGKVRRLHLSRRALVIAGSCLLVVIFGTALALSLSHKNAGETLAANASPAPSPTETLALVPSPSIAPSPSPEPTPTATPDPTLKYGMDSAEVQKLQERLMKLGYLELDDPTEHFGPATKSAVQIFQRQHSLSQDGVAGPQTLAAIYSDEAQKYTLLEGASGEDVKSFQRRLKELGYLSAVDGKYGTKTIEAVKAFQKENKLGVDGKAGEQTFSLIYSPEAKQSPAKAAEARTNASISKMISVAQKQLGKKYILGHEGPNSFDCSGLVYYCLKQAGSNRGRFNAAGYSRVSDWKKLTSIGDLKKGDLIFFYDNNFTKVGHVGIYIGGGMMIDASSSNGKVVKRSCTTAYWKKHFVCGRRPW